MERLSIQGDYFDCQLYGGRLYLWTFHGSLRVYNYWGIINWWVGSLRREIGQPHRCEHYEYEASRYCISEEMLSQFLIYERDYLTNEFPSGTEFISWKLYEANAQGLFCCQANLYEKLKAVEKVWDAPLFSVKGAPRRGLVCCAGFDGVFWCPPPKGKMDFKKLTGCQSINAEFCNPGIYAYSSTGEPYLIRREKDRYVDSLLFEKDLFSYDEDVDCVSRLSWTWRDRFFFADSHRLLVYEFGLGNHPMHLINEIKFFSWKGNFVSAGSCDAGTVVELDNAICLFADGFKEQWDGCTLAGPVTRWRFYPRTEKYQSHVHVIFNDRMDIVALKGIEVFL